MAGNNPSKLRNLSSDDELKPVKRGDWHIWVTGLVSLGLFFVFEEFVLQGVSYSNSFEKGLFSLKHDNNLMAKLEFGQSITANPNDTKSYLYRAIANQRMQQYDEAIADYSKVIELDPDNLLAFIGRASCLEKQKQFEMAILDCTAVINLNRKYSDAYLVRAIAFNDTGQYKKAIEDCNFFLQAHPQKDRQRAEALSNRALAFSKINKNDAALSDLTQAIECAPADGLIRLSRAVVFKSMNDYQRALNDCNDAEKLHSGNLSIYSIRSCCYSKLGNAKAALADLDHLAKFAPSKSTHFNRGKARLALHDYNGAIDDFDWILELEPQDKEANSNREIALSALKHNH